MSSIDVNLTYLHQHSVRQAKKVTGVVTNTRIYDFVSYFTFKIKSCQNQNLCFKLFNSHSDKGFRKDLQSIIASSMTNWGTLAHI